jgi:hypothetical protein
VQFTATVATAGGASNAVIWEVSGKNSPSTSINTYGLLTIAANETSTHLTVRARSVFDPTKYGDYSLTNSPVGIETVNAATKVYSYGGALHITTATAGTYYIYTLTGLLVESWRAASPGDTANIPLAKGVYIVRTDRQTWKVIIQN